MYRIAIEKLYKWKNNKRRKPLIIEGARQVGKTWLMKEFGKQAYADTVFMIGVAVPPACSFMFVMKYGDCIIV